MTTALMLLLTATMSQVTYEPTWESLDTRPNPQWFEDAKFGIFIHWGVYSVPAWGPRDRYSEWYWHDMKNKESETWQFHVDTYGERFTYQDFAPMFKAEMYDPDFWAEIFERSGAKYVVITSKHHDGFSLWPDKNNWNWNAQDIGPNRDLLGELTEAVRARGLRMGFYYSFYEWFNPIYHDDVDRYVDQYMLPQLKDLVERYQPALVWPDGEWDHPYTTWRSTEFLAWLFNESSAPDDVAINDRWGRETRSRHGGFATPEYQHRSEGPLMDAGRFEECQGMGKSFGYNRNERAEDYRSTAELLELLIDTVSRGGNLLLDIGPSADGRIPELQQERLLQIGAWLDVNGEAIYGTTRWDDAPEIEDVRFTLKGDTVYAICLKWPGTALVLPNVVGASAVHASLVGYDGELDTVVADDTVTIHVPCIAVDQMPCEHAWAFRLTAE